MSTPKNGWNYLYNAKKQHWFASGRSLCGRWMILSTADCELLPYYGIDCCVVCNRKVLVNMQNGFESLGNSTEIRA